MAVFSKLEKIMPELLEEMRKDLTEHPLTREFILLSERWSYGGDDHLYLIYYYETHDHLDGKITILCNHHLIADITYNNVKRYNFTEDLVDYLTQAS